MLSDFLFSANVIVPIFLLILLGYVLTRLRLWDEHFLKIANDVCFKCLLPVLLFYNVASANIFDVFNGKLILYVCICACVLCGLLFLVVPLFVKDNKRRGVMIQGTFRSNFLLFGVPLGLSIGGDKGAVLLRFGSALAIVNGVAEIVVGIAYLDKRELRRLSLMLDGKSVNDDVTAPG